MSVVVFDGKELVADSFLAAGGMLATCTKMAVNEHFTFAFTGSPALAQDMASRLFLAWPKIFNWNQYSMDLNSNLVEDTTRVLVLPHNDDESMWLLEAGLPALQLQRQPFYLGADEGVSIFNWCKATYPAGTFAQICVEMCITASKVSAEPFATFPLQTPQVK